MFLRVNRLHGCGLSSPEPSKGASLLEMRRIDLFSNAQAPDMSGDLHRGERYLFSGAYGNNSFHEASPKLVSKSQEK
jgi:hypothetical protein